MTSKFNCLNTHAAASKSKESKETKLQKYLRERNQKVLEKCFNIKLTPSEPLVVVTDQEKAKEIQIAPEALSAGDKEISIETKTTPVTVKAQEKEAETKISNHEMVSQQTKPTQVKSSDFMDDYAVETKSIKTETVTKKIVAKETKSMLTDGETVKTHKSTQTHDKDKRSNKKLAPQRCASKGNVEYCKSTHVMYSVTRLVKVKKTKSTVWRSSVSLTTTTSSKRRVSSRQQQNSPFDYDLSRDEQKFAGQYSTAMKPPAEAELELLKKGQRKEYLTQRYGHSPVAKYNYPEATSWRIGWLHRQSEQSAPQSSTLK